MVPRKRRLLLAALLVGTTIGCDQCAKQLARAALPPGQPIALLPGLVLCLTRNTGAFLSFGSALPAGARFWTLTVGVSIGLLGLLAWLLVSRGVPAGPSTGMSLILAGGLSNLLDRLVHGGEVTDFLLLRVGPLHTGVFNLADVAISGGTLLLLITALRRPSPPRARASDAEAPPA